MIKYVLVLTGWLTVHSSFVYVVAVYFYIVTGRGRGEGYYTRGFDDDPGYGRGRVPRDVWEEGYITFNL